MKYSMYLKHYVSKSPYPYYIIQADEELTKFEVWSRKKTINAWLYTEQEVIAMIEKKYPNAERIEHVDRSRRTQTPKPQYLPKEQHQPMRKYTKEYLVPSNSGVLLCSS